MRCSSTDVASTGESADCCGDLFVQGSPLRLSGRWQSPDHDVGPWREPGEYLVGHGLQPPAHEIAPHGDPDGLAHDKAESHHIWVRTATDVRDGVRSGEASSATHSRLVVRPPRDAIGFGEHR